MSKSHSGSSSLSLGVLPVFVCMAFLWWGQGNKPVTNHSKHTGCGQVWGSRQQKPAVNSGLDKVLRNYPYIKWKSRQCVRISLGSKRKYPAKKSTQAKIKKSCFLLLHGHVLKNCITTVMEISYKNKKCQTFRERHDFCTKLLFTDNYVLRRLIFSRVNIRPSTEMGLKITKALKEQFIYIKILSSSDFELNWNYNEIIDKACHSHHDSTLCLLSCSFY